MSRQCTTDVMLATLYSLMAGASVRGWLGLYGHQSAHTSGIWDHGVFGPCCRHMVWLIGGIATQHVCGFGTDLGAVLAMACLWKHSDEAYCKLASPAMRLHGPSGIQWHYVTSAVLLNLIGISNLIGTPWAERILAYEEVAVFLPGSWCVVYQRALRSLE